jgi:hypothetical protein
MANSNSSTSLYGFTNNSTVTTTNYTTLYNTGATNVVNSNVPGTNFTTLYSSTPAIKPTTGYGNANVEAFLNAGSDAFGNVVQNIIMTGNLSVGKNSYLGSNANVKISGGENNYFLSTDGSSNLIWKSLEFPSSTSTPYIHFDVTNTGNNQTFMNTQLSVYSGNYYMNVFKNGVNIEPNLYTIVGDVLTVNILLNDGDTIDVLATESGIGGLSPAGNIYEVQYNGGAGLLSSNNFFAFNPSGNSLSVGPQLLSDSETIIRSPVVFIVTTTGITPGSLVFQSDETYFSGGNINLGANGNVKINGGSTGQYLTTDGTGNLSWVTGSGGGGNGTPGGSNTDVQFNSNGNFSGSNAFTFDNSTNTLFATNISGSGANISNVVAISANIANIAYSVSGANVVGTVANANYALNSNLANIAITSYNVAGANVSGIVANANYASYAGNISGNVANANYSAYSGNITINAQPNITSLGTISNLVASDFTSTGNVIIQRAFEKYTVNSTGSTGTVNFDVLSQSIIFDTANATANFTLNIRGNSTTTLNTILPIGDTVTVVYLNTVGATPYIANTIQIDGNTVTPKYVGGLPPTTGIRLPNAIQSYTYSVIKSAANTYTVLGSLTEFQ